MTKPHQDIEHFDNSNDGKNKNVNRTFSKIKKTIPTITKCLADHEKCTGKYVDWLSGNFTIICLCKCHFNRKDDRSNEDK